MLLLPQGFPEASKARHEANLRIIFYVSDFLPCTGQVQSAKGRRRGCPVRISQAILLARRIMPALLVSSEAELRVERRRAVCTPRSSPTLRPVLLNENMPAAKGGRSRRPQSRPAALRTGHRPATRAAARPAGASEQKSPRRKILSGTKNFITTGIKCVCLLIIYL